MNVDENSLLEIVTAALNRVRQKKPTVTLAIIAALTWIATCKIIGKAALLLAIPAFLMFCIKIIEED